MYTLYTPCSELLLGRGARAAHRPDMSRLESSAQVGMTVTEAGEDAEDADDGAAAAWGASRRLRGGSGWGQRILGEGEHRRECSHLRARSFSDR